MKIKAGQLAPSFAGIDIQGKPIHLEDYRGKLLLLSFQRLAACPFCGLRIYSLTLRYPILHARGLAIIAFIESPEAGILRQPYAQAAPFPIIADPQQEFYGRYGLRTSRLGFWWGELTRKKASAEAERLGFGSGPVDGPAYRMPADFLIGPDLVVRYAHYGRDAGDNLHLSQIEALMERFAMPRDVGVTQQ
jgi:peroxiredoxin Q/BCP